MNYGEYRAIMSELIALSQILYDKDFEMKNDIEKSAIMDDLVIHLNKEAFDNNYEEAYIYFVTNRRIEGMPMLFHLLCRYDDEGDYVTSGIGASFVLYEDVKELKRKGYNLYINTLF